MKICNCHKDLDAILCDIPNEWRKGIVNALCLTFQEDIITCAAIRDCETLTTLSAFSVQGTKISVTYTNEKGTVKNTSFDIQQSLNLVELEPECLEDWDTDTISGKIEQLIEAYCLCCINTTTTTTTTSTSTTSSSSTTTTTLPPNPEDFVVANLITFPNAANVISAEPSVYYTIITGSFPITNGNMVIADHSGFTNEIFGVTLGPAISAIGTANISIYKNDILHECIDASNGVPLSGNTLYSFTIPLSATSTDLIEIIIQPGVC